MIKVSQKFIKDQKGKPKSVILSYREYKNILEDLHDLAIVAERRKQKSIAHKDFVAGLKKDGLL